MRATEAVSRAAPDGHTWLVGTSSQLVHNIALFDPPPVDITRAPRGVAMINEAPELPTLIEGGIADFIAGTWNSIALPAATPDAVIARVNALVNEVVQAPAMRARLADIGSFVPPSLSPAEVDAYYARKRSCGFPWPARRARGRGEGAAGAVIPSGRRLF